MATAPAAKKPVDIYGTGATVTSSNPAMTKAISDALAAYEGSATTKRTGDRFDANRGMTTTYGITEDQALKNAFKAAGLDEKLIPKNVDLGMYKTLTSYNGVGNDPLAVLRESTKYDDGRTKDEANTRDYLAKGLANGQTSEEMWKNIQGYNDSQRGKNSGFELLSGGVSHLGKVVAENPMAQTVISMAAAAYGVPPNVTMALLSANNVGQGQSIESVVKNVAMQYAGGKLGDMAGGAAKEALGGVDGVSAGATKGLTNAASGAAKGALNSAVNGGDIFTGALKGGVGGVSGAVGSEVSGLTDNQFLGDVAKIGTTAALSGKGLNASSLAGAGMDALGRTDTFKDISDTVSSGFKDAGLDGIDIDGFNIPGSIDLKGNLIPGLDRNGLPVRIAETIAKDTPIYKGVAGVVNKLKTPSGIASLVNGPRATAPPRRPPPAAVMAKYKQPKPTGTAVALAQPPAAVLQAFNKPKPPGG